MKSSLCILGLIALSLAPGHALAQTREEAAAACKTDPNYRSQDFTLGKWEVVNGDRKIATVVMERVLNDCAIRQTWRPINPQNRLGSVDGVFSYSRFNAGWLYTFATDYNNSNYFVGKATAPNKIEYVVPPRQLPNGNVRMQRWSLMLRPDGKVSELSLVSEDGGKSWVQEYDLIWTKTD